MDMGEFKLKDYNMDDTIAAIATFPAKSALGVIKISGRKAIEVVSKIFLPKKKKDIRKAKTYTLHYGWIFESYPFHHIKGGGRVFSNKTSFRGRLKAKTMVDEVLVSIMRGPYSYTKEDVVEISSHGGLVILNKILELLLKEGVRLALPGEFTYRALVRGRISLLEAQGVLDVVEAKSEEGLKLAARQLRGEFSQKIRELKEKIKAVFVQVESCLNFPDEGIDISFSQISRIIKSVEKKITGFLEGSRQAIILREGVKCVICGKANVGKSTLFNRLLKEERVLVSKIPGTTRDVIEETINIRGIPLVIYDTAGILEPKDLVTKKAMDRSMRTLNEADLVILVFDWSKPLSGDDYFLLEKAKDKNTIFAINKVDLKQGLKSKDILNLKGCKVKLSVLKDKDMRKLEDIIYKSVCRDGLNRQDMISLNYYQQQILERVRVNLLEAIEFLEKGYSIDFLDFSLKEALDNLGKLSGDVSCEEVLESIFSKFCIGK
jgi:tRNA modification GTPase